MDWECSIHSAIYLAMNQVVRWDFIKSELLDLMAMQSILKLGSSIPDPHDLPSEYLQTLVTLKDLLSAASTLFRRIFKYGVFNSPPMSHLWDEKNFKVYEEFTLKEISTTDLLPGLLAYLACDEGGVPLHLITAHIERNLEADVGQRDRLTPYVWESMADVEVVAEIHQQVLQSCPKISLPWQHGANYNWRDLKGVRKIVEDAVDDCLKPISQALRAAQLAKYGSPVGGRFDCPADKKSSLQRVDKMQSAERSLDYFWAQIDDIVLQKTGKSIGDILPALNFSDRILQRTPDYIPVVQKRSPANLNIALDTYSPFPSHRDQSDSFKFSPSTAKPKLKTRGSNFTPDDSTVEEESEVKVEERIVSPTARQAPMKLNQRDLHVFQTLFHQQCQQDITLGQVKWNDLVHAMASCGFTYQSLGGSAWLFIPTSGDRGITFHEPHPGNKISFWMGRHTGRRLQRAYGWSRESFVAVG